MLFSYFDCCPYPLWWVTLCCSSLCHDPVTHLLWTTNLAWHRGSGVNEPTRTVSCFFTCLPSVFPSWSPMCLAWAAPQPSCSALSISAATGSGWKPAVPADVQSELSSSEGCCWSRLWSCSLHGHLCLLLPVMLAGGFFHNYRAYGSGLKGC